MQVARNGFVVLTVLTTTIAFADELSGPKVGSAVSPLKVFATTGDHAGKELDFAAERAAKPTVYLFLQHERFDRPLARLMKALEKAAIEVGNDCSLVTVFLTDDQAKTKEHLPRVQMSLQFTANPLVVFPSASMGPEGWLINTDAQLTAVVVKDGKVAASIGYRSANETVAPEIVAALKKSVEK